MFYHLIQFFTLFTVTFLEIKELDRTLLALTVDKIYIYENKQIKIRIRYQDVIEKMKVIKRFYTEYQTECRKEVG